MKEHPLVLFAPMWCLKLEEVEAGNFDTIFINDILCHFSDEEVIEQLKRIGSWLSKLPIERSKLELRMPQEAPFTGGSGASEASDILAQC